MNQNEQRIAIIGTGFAGTVTAVRILMNARKAITLYLIEKSSGQKVGGLAFGESRSDWAHMLNLQAGRISIFREKRFDFLNWANEEANRETWDVAWKDLHFGLSSPVSRRLYQKYLLYRLEQATKLAPPLSSVNFIDGEVVDIDNFNSQVKISINVYKNEKIINKNLNVDQLILATGHLENKLPKFAESISESPLFIGDQYSDEGKNVIQNINKYDSVLIIGSGLRAYDAIMSLHINNHQGKIFMISRDGLVHPIYPSNHVHDIINIDPPLLDFDDVNINVENKIPELIKKFKTALESLKKQSNEPESVLIERILKAWEPYMSKIVNSLPDEVVHRFYNKFKTYLTANRVGVVPEIGNIIENMKTTKYNNTEPQLSFFKGEITKMELQNNLNKITVYVKKDYKEEINFNVSIVISSIGRETDYTIVKNTLWRNLLSKGLAIPHSKTRRGITVSKYGNLINSDDRLSNNIFAVGIMREGDETQRNGRVGPFVFSIGPLRNQAINCAIAILNKLEHFDFMYVNPDNEYSLDKLNGDNLNSKIELLTQYNDSKNNEDLKLLLTDMERLYVDLFNIENFYKKDSIITDIKEAWEKFIKESKIGKESFFKLIQLKSMESALDKLTDISKVTYQKETNIKVIVKQESSTRSIANIDQSNQQYPIDRPVEAGGTGKGRMGGEMFLIGLGGCFMSTLLAEITAHKAPIYNVEIETVGALSKELKKFTDINLIIHASYDDKNLFNELIEISIDKCIVLNTLKENINLHIKLK